MVALGDVGQLRAHKKTLELGQVLVESFRRGGPELVLHDFPLGRVLDLRKLCPQRRRDFQHFGRRLLRFRAKILVVTRERQKRFLETAHVGVSIEIDRLVAKIHTTRGCS